MAVDPEEVHSFLTDRRESGPEELEHYFIQFEDYWERKLWHELTDVLIEYFKHPASAPERIRVYHGFVKIFASKINQLKLVTIGLRAASQYKNDEERLPFVSALATEVDTPASHDAFVYASAAAASIKLVLGDFAGARAELDKCEEILDALDAVETVVHASFYRVNGDYYKAKQDFASYYRNALLYLACIDIASLSEPERQSRAYDLSVAALASDTIYNFGELLLHPILDSLKGTRHAWLRELLIAYNQGDLSVYDRLASNLASDELLHQNQQFLYQKMSLSALTETFFERPSHQRAMTFADIIHETKVQPDEIEHLIMKALSLGLIRGTVDQVSRIARVSWVQPKVLDMGQIDSMLGRLQDWDRNVNQLGTWIESTGGDVWAT